MPRKNQIFLIDVLADLPEKFKLILAGPKIEAGPNYNGDLNYLQTIKTNISQKQLTDRVLVIEDYVLSSVYMKLSDLYFMPAWGEGLGTPMLEAIACGLPVVANANEPAFCEWIKNGHNGQLVPIDSASQWSDAVINLSDFDPVKRTKISEEMKSSVNNEIINSQYLQHIKTLMKV